MTSFQEMALRPELLNAISDMGFEQPTPIQIKAIPHLIDNQIDLIALAQTGTGKTAAFGLPLIQQLDFENSSVQAIIICPTRELCLQISKDFTKYSKYLPDFKLVSVYGGDSIEKQLRALKKNPQVVVGTPGRVLDFIKRRALKLHAINTFVLDEADEMLTMGFKEELEAIMEALPEEKQTLLFSATMSKEISRIAKTYMDSPMEIKVSPKQKVAENISHHYYVTSHKDRFETLKRILDINPNCYAIVFCRTRQETREIAEELLSANYNADALHGDLSQNLREKVLQRFRSKYLQILVATDVAARGLDVTDLTHVIHYRLPQDTETYIHRSGRTGRAGKLGTSISIILKTEVRKLKQIEKMVKKTFDRQLIPQGVEVCKVQLLHMIDTIKNIEVDNEKIEQFMPAIYEKLEHLYIDELIRKFVYHEFSHLLSYYEVNSDDLNVKLDAKRERKPKLTTEEKESTIDYTEFCINVGRIHKMTPAKLIRIINENTTSRDISIGRISHHKEVTYFGIDKKYVPELLANFKDASFEGRPLAIFEQSSPEPSRSSRRSKDSSKRSKGSKFKRGGESDFDDYSPLPRKKRNKRRSRNRPSGAKARAMNKSKKKKSDHKY